MERPPLPVETAAKGKVSGASRVLRWVPDRLPLRFAALQASGKALLRDGAPVPSTAFPGACSESGMRPGTQRKTPPRSGAELISQRSPLGRGVPRSNGRHDVEAGRTRRGDEPGGLLFAQVDALDLGAARALAAELQDLLDPRAGSGEDGLDAAVLAVAHPAVEGPLDRVLLDEIAKAHPLHAAMDGDVDEAAVGHELSWPGRRMPERYKESGLTCKGEAQRGRAAGLFSGSGPRAVAGGRSAAISFRWAAGSPAALAAARTPST